MNTMNKLDLFKQLQRVSFRLNKQIYRAKKSGLAPHRELSRVPEYRSKKAQAEFLNTHTSADIEYLISTIEQRASGDLFKENLTKEYNLLIRDIAMLVKGSHIGAEPVDNKQLNDIIKSFTPEDLQVLFKARQQAKLHSDEDLFYELMRRLKIQGKNINVLNSKADIMREVNSVINALENKEIDYSTSAIEIAKQKLKRW